MPKATSKSKTAKSKAAKSKVVAAAAGSAITSPVASRTSTSGRKRK